MWGANDANDAIDGIRLMACAIASARARCALCVRACGFEWITERSVGEGCVRRARARAKARARGLGRTLERARRGEARGVNAEARNSTRLTMCCA